MDFGFTSFADFFQRNKRHIISLSMLFTAFMTITVIAYAVEAQAPTTNVTTATTTTVVTTTVAPATTTTTVPPTTTTTLNLSGVDWEALRQAEIDAMRDKYGICGEYHDLAISIGWPEEEWETLSRIMWRESNCLPNAWSGSDAGLMQINRIHTEWAAQMGFTYPNDLYIPENNLYFAYRLWETSGWKPWRFSGEVPS